MKPIRNYFLEESNYGGIKRRPGDISFLVVQRFGELLRKLWNPKNFKSHVSPHEMLQARLSFRRIVANCNAMEQIIIEELLEGFLLIY